jgi:GTP pyrophosphokinase
MINVDQEEEKQEILKRYRQLLRVSKWSREKGDIGLIRQAFELAVNAHSSMRRKSGEPYIYHPLAVAKIAAEEIGLGTTSIVCALLHDVVEDTEVELSEIEDQFGSKVADIINGLTKISGVFDQTSSPQAENFRKMLLTLATDVRVILIKLCDRLHNMRTLEHMSAKGQLKIASETTYLYAPLAHRLGLYAIKTELEDLSLKYTEPVVYQDIKKELSATKEQRNRFIRSFIKPIKIELDQLGLNYEIKGRPKSIHSILNKMRKQNINFGEVYDLFAIRIILDSETSQEKLDCWNVYSIITSIYKPNPDRLRDWISIPRTNGYESLHTTVMGPKGQWVEVQIRTIRMDEIAEKGYAAHWKYKENNDSNSGLDDWLQRVRDVLEHSKENTMEFLDDFKMNLFSDEIYVFTPKGELKKLPAGSTALDFAFEIHSEVGASCIGAKVNHKLVPLSSQLQNGDQIEVITSAKQTPSKNWLEFVVTGKAKTKIRQSLKDEKRKVAEYGKEQLQRKFRNASMPFRTDKIKIIYEYFGFSNELDFFFALAQEKIQREDIKVKEIIKNFTEKSGPTKGTGFDPSLSKQKNEEIIIGDSDVSLEYAFAGCCHPINGDPIVGFITIGDGVKIHRTNCKNAKQLMSNYGYRIIKARWAEQVEHDLDSFQTTIEITGIDSMGLVSKITDIISKQLKVNMKSIEFGAHDGTFTGVVVLQVSGINHLNELMEEIRDIDQYIKVSRKLID